MEVLESTLDSISGASLYEHLKHYERVQLILVSDLTEFRASCARDTLTGVHCTKLFSYPELAVSVHRVLLNSTSRWRATSGMGIKHVVSVRPYPARPYATFGTRMQGWSRNWIRGNQVEEYTRLVHMVDRKTTLHRLCEALQIRK